MQKREKTINIMVSPNKDKLLKFRLVLIDSVYNRKELLYVRKFRIDEDHFLYTQDEQNPCVILANMNFVHKIDFNL